ncbi:methyl-accepting chemotaxis protein [Ferrimonas marina]|uniref:Methyl-accepting chemotaxis sensory transducer with Cache sensor n=1 Tax=Ferrimonas marina TaxID=299255 RepID=A0A1M5YHB6_9GAMM|nr:methyl-accepting chemotaxis protein [Ferrimonas marina]SHI11279.1 methyl-accepting chemotaxis sensory transducer with Cache sensor [Ferrimonas marina]
MDFLRHSLIRQLVAAIAGTVFLILLIASFYLVHTNARSAESQLRQGIDSLLAHRSAQVQGFFEAKGQVVHSVFANPQVVDFFSQYRSRGSDLSRDRNYPDVVRYFRFFSDQDSSIKSVFFGSEHTHEYFDLNGRYEGDPNYYTAKRPWWGEARQMDRLFVTDPAVDANDGSISATVKTTVYDAQGRFIGIGGMDILISTLGELLSQVNYQDQGQAFLLTDDGKTVFFPGFDSAFQPGDLLAQISGNDNQGFEALQREMIASASGNAEVLYRGEPMSVQWQSLNSDYPQVQWRLGLLMPKAYLQQQVNSVRWRTALNGLGFTLLLSLLLWALLQPLRRQLNRLLRAMEEVGDGEADLRRRIRLDRQDELGRLGGAFNRFAERLHQLVSQSREATDLMTGATDNARTLCQDTLYAIEQQQSQLDQVSTATTEMAQTSHEMARSTEQVSEHALAARSQVAQATEAVMEAEQGMGRLNQQVQSAATVVSALRENADQIGEVLEVIRTIAEQTNLLALNAAIEAARAGEQGRGFAVVADEVRTLASRTQDSTANIQRIIEQLQQTSEAAQRAMQQSCDEARASEAISHQLSQALGQTNSAVEGIQLQVQEISAAVSQQASVAGDIDEKMVQIRDLSQGNGQQAQALEGAVSEMTTAASELERHLAKFKV